MKTDGVQLEGKFVRLEPLELEHLDALCEVALDPELWRWVTHPVTTRPAMQEYISAAISLREAGLAVPFATVEMSSGTVVGSTRFGSIDHENRRAEIGWTFVATPWQRTSVNTEAKYLMLRWGFEEQGLQRIELKTDRLNERSQRAIERIGAQREGVFRKHMVCADGRIRDTVYYSLVDEEWPACRRRLEAMLEPST